MVLDNYYNALMAIVAADRQFLTFTNYVGGTITSRPGTTATTASILNCLGFANMRTVLTAVGTKPAGVIFGTGTTPPARSDYKLSGDVVSGISCSSVGIGQFDESGNLTIGATYTIVNNNESPVTIAEIGYYSQFVGSTSFYAMFERTVLDSPVTIPAGGVGQITYTIKMAYPTD